MSHQRSFRVVFRNSDSCMACLFFSLLSFIKLQIAFSLHELAGCPSKAMSARNNYFCVLQPFVYIFFTHLGPHVSMTHTHKKDACARFCTHIGMYPNECRVTVCVVTCISYQLCECDYLHANFFSPHYQTAKYQNSHKCTYI